MIHPRYARAPSTTLRGLLSADGMLASLLKPRIIAGLRLDVHLRENDHVHAYCGLTRILDASSNRGCLRLNAAPIYRSQSCAAGLFRNWPLNDPACAIELDRYLTGVVPEAAWTSREGAVQAAWGAIVTPWVPLDREAVLGYPSKSAQIAARNVSMVRAAQSQLARVQKAEGWARLPNCERGSELDQLAIDQEGRLVLIELKYAQASASSVYYAPFQLLQYAHEWSLGLKAVRSDLDAVREARIAIGLTPPNIPKLREGLRAVLAFGEEHCSPQVESRLDRTCEIVCQHLPPGVPPIEVWAMRGGVPKRLR